MGCISSKSKEEGTYSAERGKRIIAEARKSAQTWQDAFNGNTTEGDFVGKYYDDSAVLHVDLGQAVSFFSSVLNVKDPNHFVCRGKANITQFWKIMKQITGSLEAFGESSNCSVCVENDDSMVLKSLFDLKSKSDGGGLKGWIHARYMVRDSSKGLLIKSDLLSITDCSLPSEIRGLPEGGLGRIHCNATLKLDGRSCTDADVFQSLFPDAEQFKTDFNKMDPAGCAGAYGDTTVMHVDMIEPVADQMKEFFKYPNPYIEYDKKEIQVFWDRMINMVGLKDMKGYDRSGEYHISICVLDDLCAFVASSWRMNAVGGEIHAQRMTRTGVGKPWIVTSDFFGIYQAYAPDAPAEMRKSQSFLKNKGSDIA